MCLDLEPVILGAKCGHRVHQPYRIVHEVIWKATEPYTVQYLGNQYFHIMYTSSNGKSMDFRHLRGNGQDGKW